MGRAWHRLHRRGRGSQYGEQASILSRTFQQAVAACVRIGVNPIPGWLSAGTSTKRWNPKAIGEKDIDAALRGKFRVKLRLGLLDPPSQVPYAKTDSTEEPWQTDAHKAVARRVARESIVLLEANEGRLLPLNAGKIKSIAVYGPRANRKVLLGLYSGEPPYSVSPLDGLRKKLGSGVKSTWAPDSRADIATAAKSSDAAIVFGWKRSDVQSRFDHRQFRFGQFLPARPPATAWKIRIADRSLSNRKA